MVKFDGLLSALAHIPDKVIGDQARSNGAKSALPQDLASPGHPNIGATIAQGCGAQTKANLWTSCARPGFLYVMYAMLLWALPLGIVGAFSPSTAAAMARSMTLYLQGIPEPLYALFGTAYLGYSAMRQWGKFKGSDR